MGGAEAHEAGLGVVHLNRARDGEEAEDGKEVEYLTLGTARTRQGPGLTTMKPAAIVFIVGERGAPGS